MSNGINRLCFEGFTLDRELRQLRQGETPVALPGKAFDLLLFMAENPGRPLLKSELLQAVWPDSFVEEANLSQNVFLLRKALGPAGGRSIVTLPGRGYQFAAHVLLKGVAEEPVPAPAAAPQMQRLEAIESRIVLEEVTEEHVSPWRSSWVRGSMLAAAVLLAVAAWLGWQRYQDRTSGPPVQVVLADLDGTTGDPVLDRTLTTITRMELAQSPFVSLVPSFQIRSTLLQMTRKPEDGLPLAAARDVCERLGSQAVLRETIARAGSGFLLTEEATNCVDGANVAQAHEAFTKIDDLPPAIAKIDAVVRRQLGESRRTIARFNAPLAPVTTNSIDALKDYSQAVYLSQHAHYSEASELLKQAVALDPQFATAWLDLSSFADNSLDKDVAKVYLTKAYNLRQYGTEPARLVITARYNELVTGDLFESLRIYRGWIALYPRQILAWSGLTNLERDLGRPEDELVAARRLLQLLPNNLVSYQSVAGAQMRTGDFAASRDTCRLAFSRGFDGDALRFILIQDAYELHDEALLAEQVAWGDAHPDSPVLFAHEGELALMEGRTRDARQFFDRMNQAFVRLGTPDAGARIVQGEALAFFRMGYPDEARERLKAGPIRAEFDNYMVMADLGQQADAARLLHDQLASHPQSTLWNQDYKLLLEGGFAMAAGKPQEAIGPLEAARPFDRRSADNLYMRGKAYAMSNRLPEAEREFRALLGSPGTEPVQYEHALVLLELARVLAREGRTADAREAYTRFLAGWAHADVDQPLLLQARREAAVLGVS